jgi:hypothetical protein
MLAWQRFLRVVDSMTKSIKSYPTGEKVDDVIWNTLIGSWANIGPWENKEAANGTPSKIENRYQAFKTMVDIRQPKRHKEAFKKTVRKCGSLYDILSSNDICLSNSIPNRDLSREELKKIISQCQGNLDIGASTIMEKFVLDPFRQGHKEAML